jgi:hypothetical protein
MNKHFALLGAIWALLTLPVSASAGQITKMQLYDTSPPIVTVTYSNADGTGSNSLEVYADPQVSGHTKAPIYYCIDLWHDNEVGSTYTITPVSTLSFAATSKFSDVDNRLAWLMNQPQDTADERGAVQLAMWYTIDNVPNNKFSGFSFSGGDDALQKYYNDLIRFREYDQSVSYAAQLWAATHDGGKYQDVISASVPEPAGRTLLGVGLLAVVCLHFRRSRRPMPATR